MTSPCKAAVFLLAVALGLGGGTGCATRKYVRQQVAPLQNQVDRAAVEDKAQNSQIARLAESSTTMNAGLLELSQAVKKQGALTLNLSGMMAGSAAPGRATPSPVTATVPRPEPRFSFDDYRPAGEPVLVQFASGSAWLSAASKQAIDAFAAQALVQKGHLLTVEGYTDSTGNSDRNLTLSQRRAQNVVAYLVSQHEIPVYRIYTAGLGSGKPVDWQSAPASLAKNRRVEVRLYVR